MAKHRAIARQDAQNGTCERPAQDREIGGAEVRFCRPEPANRGTHDIARLRIFQITDDFGEAENAHRQHGEIDAVRQILDAERHALLTCFKVGADSGEHEAQKDHADRLQDRATRQHDCEHEAHDHQREIFRGAKQLRELGQRLAEGGNEERCNSAREKRAHRRNAERHAGAALLGHLVTIEHSHDRRRLAGDIDENGRRRSTVLRAVINASEHDQGARRIEAEGDRQQHRDGRDRTNARQHADERADHTADKTKENIVQRQCNAETKREITEKGFHVG